MGKSEIVDAPGSNRPGSREGVAAAEVDAHRPGGPGVCVISASQALPASGAADAAMATLPGLLLATLSVSLRQPFVVHSLDLRFELRPGLVNGGLGLPVHI